MFSFNDKELKELQAITDNILKICETLKMSLGTTDAFCKDCDELCEVCETCNEERAGEDVFETALWNKYPKPDYLTMPNLEGLRIR